MSKARIKTRLTEIQRTREKLATELGQVAENLNAGVEYITVLGRWSPR
ncbi:hypothetical protein [Nocardia farcinica]|nr:hypothetical protein [Nocardia farcinica]MBA4856639.1 hypothetical protein [Nocardia farcinica]MBC9818783.1 hypothetical protein [Nocardia farcinica]MBF6234548.1 hypothetical protein [Nocardia farcinica]MBF6253068.1 hypothetical protein [Nocardia farcinica]MBF6271695.1 hypothetical protein [Nocardia farcinica]